jgi:hypothetical protein
VDPNPAGTGRGPRDIRGDKRKEETVMLSSDNVADLVAQAKAEAAAATPPAATPQPAATPAPAAASASTGPNRTVLIAGAVAAVVLVVVLVLVLAG